MSAPKLRFKADDKSEFPEWEKYRFFELIDNIIDFRGRTPKKLGMEWASCKTDHLALSAVNVKMGYIDFNIDPHYGDDDLYNKWMSGHELHKGNVLFTTEAPMGNVAQIPDHKPYILSQRTIVLNPKTGVVSENFLAKLLESPLTQEKLRTLATGGTAQGVSQKSLSNLIVNISISNLEQEKIAEFFQVLDNVISETQSEIDVWEKQKRGVMQMLFSRKVRFKADDGSEFPEWEERRLDECCEVFTDGDWIESKDQSNSGVRLIQTGNIGVTEYFDKPNNMKWISESTFLKLHCKEVFPGDILISRLPAPAGRACIVPDLGVKMITAVDCTIIRTTFDCNKEFLVQYLATPQYFNQVNSALAGGTRQRISRGNLAEIMIPYPCIEEQQKIAACLSGFDDVIEKAKKELEAYRELKKGLLQQMFV